MANECQIFEQIAPRLPGTSIRTTPFVAKQTLSTTGVSNAFNGSTQLITVVTSLAGTLEFSTAAGVDPGGSGMTFPIAANVPYDFAVKAGAKVRFV